MEPSHGVKRGPVVRDQGAEDRGQKSEVRRQRTGDRGQKSEVRSQRTEWRDKEKGKR